MYLVANVTKFPLVLDLGFSTSVAYKPVWIKFFVLDSEVSAHPESPQAP